MTFPAPVRNVVDAALEATVVPSFTRVGFAVRRTLGAWDEPTPGCMRGRVVLVTGSTSGIGCRTAHRLSELGAEVIVNGREEPKTEDAAGRIAEETGQTTHPLAGDVGDIDDVRALANAVRRDHDRLDVLVHNAGVLVHEHATTPQGVERTVATHVVGPFLLTTLLLPLLRAAAPARVITVTSGGMYTQRLDVDRLEAGPDGFDGVTAYARAKRAQVALARAWGQRVEGQGVVVHATHPGWVDTPGVAGSLPGFHRAIGRLLRDPDQGADTIVWLATAGEALESTGMLWHDRRVRRSHHLPWTRRNDEAVETRRLVAWCADRAGMTDAEAALLDAGGEGERS
jgi:dehydrogenase/reductase SDR family member 12